MKSCVCQKGFEQSMDSNNYYNKTVNIMQDEKSIKKVETNISIILITYIMPKRLWWMVGSITNHCLGACASWEGTKTGLKGVEIEPN